MENKFNPSEDSIVFSALYENYETYIKDDNPNKKLGMWSIEEERQKNLKYAYVYLTDCGGMLVKKYHILGFERDINTPDKYHFYFEKGEDFFVQYPFGIVQGHHYVSSLKLDNLPRLENSEITQRVEKSKNTKMNKIRREKIIRINSREKLSKIYISKYLLQKQRIKLSDTNMLVKLVDEGQDPDTVLTNYFSNIKK